MLTSCSAWLDWNVKNGCSQGRSLRRMSLRMVCTSRWDEWEGILKCSGSAYPFNTFQPAFPGKTGWFNHLRQGRLWQANPGYNGTEGRPKRGRPSNWVLGWGSTPEPVKNFWKLEQLRGMKFHQPIIPGNAINSVMRPFTAVDASLDAMIMGCWGCFEVDSQWSCQLIIGWGLLAPATRTVRKNELESLCGGSNLALVIKKALGTWVESSILVGDSTIALCWTTPENKRLSNEHVPQEPGDTGPEGDKFGWDLPCEISRESNWPGNKTQQVDTWWCRLKTKWPKKL